MNAFSLRDKTYMFGWHLLWFPGKQYCGARFDDIWWRKVVYGMLVNTAGWPTLFLNGILFQPYHNYLLISNFKYNRCRPYPTMQVKK
jgi:hypothetical protein